MTDYESDTCDCWRCGSAQEEMEAGLQDYLVTATVQIVVRGSSIADVGIAAKELLTDVIEVSEYKDDPANGITITCIIEWN